MIEALANIDQQAFIAVHHGLANSFFDVLMPFLREAKTWIPLYLVIVFLAIYKYKYKGLWIVVAIVITVVLTDRFSAGFMKPFFERLRPCHEPDLVEYIRHLVNCGGHYGFISSHATNHFGMAVLFTWFFQTLTTRDFVKWVFFAWAGIISFAQIYVGKHYPGDVIIGALFGVLIGVIVLRLFTKLVSIN